MRSPQSMHEVDDRLQSFSGLENSVGFQALKRAQQEALNLRSATEAFTHQFEKQPDDGSITTTSDHHRHTSDHHTNTAADTEVEDVPIDEDEEDEPEPSDDEQDQQQQQQQQYEQQQQQQQQQHQQQHQHQHQHQHQQQQEFDDSDGEDEEHLELVTDEHLLRSPMTPGLSRDVSIQNLKKIYESEFSPPKPHTLNGNADNMVVPPGRKTAVIWCVSPVLSTSPRTRGT